MKKFLSILLAFAITFTLPAGAGLQYSYAATGTAISTPEDLKAMESNPSGNYYLANDIEVPSKLIMFKNSKKPFTGTLDGNGHKLNGYKYETVVHKMNVALFQNAEGATFKNLTVSNVDINLKNGGSAASLVAEGKGCTYTNIKTTGTIKLKNRGTENDDGCDAAGIVDYESGAATFKNCTNAINIEITHKGESAPQTAGVVNTVMDGSLTSCTNNGSITVTHTPNNDWGSETLNAAGVTIDYYGNKAVTGCKNTGSISVTGNNAAESGSFAPVVAGVIINASESNVLSCTNSGKITVNNNVNRSYGASIGGVACEVVRLKKYVSKCSNTGSITYTGVGIISSKKVNIGGVVADTGKIEQSYNKGTISANGKFNASIGGVAGWTADMRNCYNTGSIIHKGSSGFAGGLAGESDVLGGYIKSNYTTGKVSGNTGKQLFKGQVIGENSGGWDVRKRNTYDNYYKTSGKAYGHVTFTWKPWLPTAKKVSSISAKSCPKLSSKIWTYSSKYKRLILKNNKEK